MTHRAQRPADNRGMQMLELSEHLGCCQRKFLRNIQVLLWIGYRVHRLVGFENVVGCQ
jgi:hypothetical protein